MKTDEAENGDLLVAMSTVKDWLLTKSKDATNILPAMKDTLRSSLTFAQVVVTPDNIPEFTIPGDGGGMSPRLSIESQEIEFINRVGGSLSASETSSPKLSPCPSRETSPCLLAPRINFMSRSAPVSPQKSNEKQGTNWDHECNNTQAAINADPYSLTAMSLPHLKAVTTYGFETLSECPNTRRKESLFHDGDLSPGQEPLNVRMQRRRVNSADSPRSPISEDGEIRVPQRKLSGRGSAPAVVSDVECRLTRKQSSKRRNVPSLVAPLGVVLPQQRRSIGETGSPLLLATPSNNSCCTSPRGPSPISFGEKCSSNSKRWDFINVKDSSTGGRRRRSGSLGRDDLRYAVSQSNELTAETHTGGKILFRRNSCSPNLMDDASSQSSYGSSLHDTASKRSSLPQSCSCQGTEIIPDLGQLHFSFQYESANSQFRVSLLRASKLVAARQGQDLNPYAKVYLMPGKMQKQSSVICRHTSSPEFNQDFLFRDLTLKQLTDMKLRIKMYSKNQNLRRADFLGEVQVALTDYSLASENTEWMPLEPRMDCEVSTHTVYI